MPRFPRRSREAGVSPPPTDGSEPEDPTADAATAGGTRTGAAPKAPLDMGRRQFLRTSGATAGIAAAGLAGVLPSLLPAAEDDGAATAEAVPAAADASSLSGPVTAHVADLSSGEVSVFYGDRTMLVHDPQLAGRILRAVK